MKLIRNMKPKKVTTNAGRITSNARLDSNLKSLVSLKRAAESATQSQSQSHQSVSASCALFTTTTTTQTSRAVSSSSATSSSSSNKNFTYTCSGCNKPIKRDKFLLKACDKYWHENCLRCDRCHSRLGELGSSLFCKSNMNLCRQDYLEMFGETGVCSVCEKLICASEMVMRAKMNVYHLECFACQLCNQRFCVGDRFYLCENKVVCQYDYDEHILPIQRSLFQQQSSHQLELCSTYHQEPLQQPAHHHHHLTLHHLQPQQEAHSLNSLKDVHNEHSRALPINGDANSALSPQTQSPIKVLSSSQEEQQTMESPVAFIKQKHRLDASSPALEEKEEEEVDDGLVAEHAVGYDENISLEAD